LGLNLSNAQRRNMKLIQWLKAKIYRYFGIMYCPRDGNIIRYLWDYDKWDNCSCGFNPNYEKLDRYK